MAIRVRRRRRDEPKRRVAVRQSLLEAWIETLAIAGVALDGLESAQVCGLRALEPLLRQAPDAWSRAATGDGALLIARDRDAATARAAAQAQGFTPESVRAYFRGKSPAA